jgi:anti-sigma28 factor (negative regulator of flagellin synthesis)
MASASAAIQAIAAVMQSAMQANTMATLDKFFALLGDKIEIDDDMQAMFDEYKASLATTTIIETEEDDNNTTNAKKTTKTTNTTKTKAPKKPRAPRATTGYNLFMTEKVKELKANGETGKLMPVVAKMWKELSDDDKAEFNQRAKDVHAGPSVTKTVTETVVGVLGVPFVTETVDKNPKPKKDAKASKKPRAATGYSLFMSEKIKELKAQGETGKLMPIVAKMWKELAADLKVEYTNRAKANQTDSASDSDPEPEPKVEKEEDSEAESEVDYE